MAKIEERKQAPKAPAKPTVISEKERLEALKGEPFVVASYHLEGGRFVLLDTFGRRLEFKAGANLK